MYSWGEVIILGVAIIFAALLFCVIGFNDARYCD